MPLPSFGPNSHLRCTVLYGLVLLPCRQEGEALARDPDDPAKVIPPDLADVPVSRRSTALRVAWRWLPRRAAGWTQQPGCQPGWAGICCAVLCWLGPFPACLS
jgi:hypothetical protein